MARAAILGLAAIAFLPSAFAKPYPTPLPTIISASNELANSTEALEKRDCPAANVCGFYAQLCCTGGTVCSTNAANEAICVAPSGDAVTGGGWVYATSTWVENGPVTKTSTYSYWADAQPTAACTGAQSPCGSICCSSGFYCSTGLTCQLLGGGSSGGIIGTLTPSAPLRPTSSTLIIVTATGSPTTTVPFETPIGTGVVGVPMEQTGGGGGLSGGAIAGIVIGVLLGLLLLSLLCLFCCFRALFDTILACFGGGRRKHTHEETYIEEHHHSSGGAAAGGRRWYGQGPARPPRSKKSSGGAGNALGIGALLGGAALALGLKRKHDRRHDEKSTVISGSSAYYSDDYTSSSSASSSDGHTRHTRQSSRR